MFDLGDSSSGQETFADFSNFQSAGNVNDDFNPRGSAIQGDLCFFKTSLYELDRRSKGIREKNIESKRRFYNLFWLHDSVCENVLKRDKSFP